MITDDTLREGMQAPGMAFTVDEKVKIAKIISTCGIKRALVAYPPAHVSEVRATERILADHIFPETFALGRAMREDVDSIAETGSNISLHLPFRMEKLDEAIDAVKYASTKGRIVEVAVVDVMKNDIRDIIRIARLVSQAGADVVQLPDTTGTGSPKKIRSLFSEAKASLDVEIEAHCHNDMGAALANSYAALEGGADHIDATVYGIGERNGITDLASLSAILESEGISTGIKESAVREAYKQILDVILIKAGERFFVRNFPSVGENVSTNTAGTHVAFSDIFTASGMNFNVYAGKSMIRRVLDFSGMKADDQEVRNLLYAVKDRSADEGKCVKVDEILKMAGEIIGKSH
jgi:2-isopropylmalate synthase